MEFIEKLERGLEKAQINVHVSWQNQIEAYEVKAIG
jgi:hypothetical protein